MFAATAAVGIGNSCLSNSFALASRSAESNWQGRALGVMQSSGSLARWVGRCSGTSLERGARRGGGAYALWALLASSGCLFAAAGGFRSRCPQSPPTVDQPAGIVRGKIQP
jgi:hypothetical protein